jgi:superfamily II DNA or RNA helicase
MYRIRTKGNGRMKTLRTDQAAGIHKLREAVAQGERRIVMQGPTGFGKTVVTADMAERARAKKKRVLVTVPALSLVDQTVEMLGEQGVTDIGVIQARHQLTDPSQPVQVASVQTLMNRSIPQSDLVVIDEVHRWFQFYERWLCDPAWQGIPVVGLSATPWTKGLGAYFGRLVIANTIKEMIAQGTLANFKVYAPTHPDLEGVRTVAGDYHEGDLHRVMRPAKLVADIIESWKTLAAGRPTVCFAVNRAHAEQIAKEFDAAGVPAGYMDCDTPLLQRQTIRTQLLTGRIQVVCNVDVIGLGVDWPEISCIIYARPTKSEMRYVQNIGRGLRAHKGKDHLLILDHSDTTLRLGFVSDIHHDELDDGMPKLTSQKVIALPKECPQCHFVKPPKTAECPACGYVTVHQPKLLTNAPGLLRELREEDVHKPAPVARRLEGKAETYGQLMWYARKHSFKDGWAAMKYKTIYGVGPIGMTVTDATFKPPEMVLASWIKAQNIRWAKSKRWNGNGRTNGNGHQISGRPEKTLVSGALTKDEEYFADEWQR